MSASASGVDCDGFDTTVSIAFHLLMFFRMKTFSFILQTYKKSLINNISYQFFCNFAIKSHTANFSISDMADHTFVTGQFVRIDQTLANAGDRAVAALLDLVVVVMIASSLSMLLLPLWDEGELQFLIYVILYVLPLLLYNFLSEWLMKGRTLGKMALGLQVVGGDGSVPSVLSLFYRWVFFLVEGYTGFGLVMMLFTKNNQRLGDLAGGTYVVKLKNVWLGNAYVNSLADFPPGYQPVYPQAAELSQRQMEVIQDAYFTHGADSESMRVELAQKVCEQLHLSVSGINTYQFFGQLAYDYRFMLAKENA